MDEKSCAVCRNRWKAHGERSGERVVHTCTDCSHHAVDEEPIAVCRRDALEEDNISVGGESSSGEREHRTRGLLCVQSACALLRRRCVCTCAWRRAGERTCATERVHMYTMSYKREKVNTFSECLDKTGSSVRRPLICLVVLIHCVSFVTSDLRN